MEIIMAGTFWAVLPPIIAIVLALLTKEVYSSLFIGILVGALLYTGFHPLTAAETLFDVMGEKVSGNMEILIFLVMLGILVSLVTKSGLPAPMENGRQTESRPDGERRLRQAHLGRLYS